MMMSIKGCGSVWCNHVSNSDDTIHYITVTLAHSSEPVVSNPLWFDGIFPRLGLVNSVKGERMV